MGKYADQDKRQELKKAIAAGGGLWCPKENVFIGGTKEKSRCDDFARFRETYKPESSKVKTKKSKI